MRDDGEIVRENNITNQLNGGNIYTIAYINKNWDLLDFRTVESIERENRNQKEENRKLYKEEYKRLLQMEVERGNLTELEMYKKLADV